MNIAKCKEFIPLSYRIIVHLLAASINRPYPEFIKLFSSFLKGKEEIQSEITRLKFNCVIGGLSNIYTINNEVFEEAYNIATQNNLIFESSALAGLVLYLNMSSQIPVNRNVSIILTGKSKNLIVKKPVEKANLEY
jgi:hypothetical protein